MKNSLRGTFLVMLVAFSLFSMGLSIKLEVSTEIASETIETKATTSSKLIFILPGYFK